MPLTVSPFVSLPVASTLPYTYKSMPSTLPPPVTGVTGATDSKPRYVVSASGHAAHPEDIIQSCKALQAHVARMQEDAEREIRELDERIKAMELAEKRRLAPGWLDSEARILEPERKQTASGLSEAGQPEEPSFLPGQFAEMSLADRQGASEMAGAQGEEMDRVFGGK